MKIFLQPLDIGPTEGFSAAKDLFQRAPLGESLTNLLRAASDPLVIAVDGQWGSGKSTFLKMWAGHLRKNGFPVIYYDAFENDYSEDAFSSLASEIVALSDAQDKGDTPAATRFLERAKGAGKVLARSALKVGVKVATMGALEASDLGDFAEAISAEVEDLTDKHVGELITAQKARRDSLEAFRSALTELPRELSSAEERGADALPLIFIIDELDRCRPLYALEIIERMKHFFSVENVHFVLGTHMGQLENSVKAAYGADIDAKTYLQKFIHLIFPLADRIQSPQQRTNTLYAHYLTRAHEFDVRDYDPVEKAVEFISLYAESLNLSLRHLERMMNNLALAVAFTRENQFRPGVIIGGLCILKVMHPSLYAKARQGTLAFPEFHDAVMRRLHSDPPGSVPYLEQYWRFAIDPNCSPDVLEKFSRILYDYSLAREDIVPYVAHSIVDHFGPMA